MTLRHLRIFHAVCLHDCHITKAAEALFMTQPAVSLAIRELENYYGIVLFDRIGRRLMITEAGKCLEEYTTGILALYDDMENRMRNWDNCGTIRVGASLTIGSKFLPQYVQHFLQQYPKVKVNAVVEPSNHLEEKILLNELDFALIEGIAHTSSLVSKPYMADSLAVICAPDSSFTSNQVLAPSDLADQNFLLREKGSGTREIFDQVMEQAGFSIQPVWESASTTALINAVISGLGIAVLPKRRVESVIAAGLVIPIQLQGLTFQRQFNIIYHKDKFLSDAARNFIQLCCTDLCTEAAPL